MKPKVICHMMSSVDGRLMPYRYSTPVNGASVDDLIEQYVALSGQLNGDASLIGRPTLQAMYFKDTFDHKDYPPTDNVDTYIVKPDKADTYIVLDPNGKIFYDNTGDNNYIAILGEKVSGEYLLHLREKRVSYLFAGHDGNDLEKALNILADDFGFKTILLEGGGIINGLFLKAGLIDELSLFICPSVDGLSGVPAIFEYRGEADELPAQGQSLELISVKQLENGVAWLYYKFHK